MNGNPNGISSLIFPLHDFQFEKGQSEYSLVIKAPQK
jgi:hypothetical protein